ncbi:copper chaperone PCu(A)C [Pseudoprimorskyibacter insulae]|uniref:Copper chaperone PCu(A)C n=1 Tax=Pseudoprimorskyibacter insulae TaxID=1695997 RepID=A0A2R8AVA5_9RHOB|nr:copper chaperone PCu(A)C [Pseudoprimorskyibacter insulae]SPF79965.1 hypothetical protein PRI8871_01767 [Pseudoprimorskyibacter insulae]
MMTKFLAGIAAVTLAAPAFADIEVHDAYARSASPSAKTGAAFMAIMNTSDADDRLIDVRSDAAKKVELHTHIANGEGVMRMVHVAEGFAIPAGETHMLARGGDHVMFMGLTVPFEQGAMVPVTLIFEQAGEITIDVPVDLERKPDAAMHKMSH